MYIYIYVCVCVCVCACVRRRKVCERVYVSVCIYSHIYMCVFAHAPVSDAPYVCLSLSLAVLIAPFFF